MFKIKDALDGTDITNTIMFLYRNRITARKIRNVLKREFDEVMNRKEILKVIVENVESKQFNPEGYKSKYMERLLVDDNFRKKILGIN